MYPEYFSVTNEAHQSIEFSVSYIWNPQFKWFIKDLTNLYMSCWGLNMQGLYVCSVIYITVSDAITINFKTKIENSIKTITKM